jgi:adenine phosphoribosyltransferase
MNLKSYIREFPNFPTAGVMFKDIAPVLKAPEAMNYIVGEINKRFQPESYDLIAGVESRGLIFASAFAVHVGKGCVMVRKKGKLPGPVETISYALEYGSDTLEVQKDAVHKDQKILIVDDLLATGGTARGACKLLENLGGKIVGFAFVIELDFLKGREIIGDYNIQTLVNYHE